MSKSIFLNLKDDNFWGNDVIGAEKAISGESIGSREETAGNKGQLVDADAGWQDSGGWDDEWEKVKGHEDRQPTQVFAPPLANPFGPSGGFGGFSRTNASEYYGGDEHKTQATPTRRDAPRKDYPNNEVVPRHVSHVPRPSRYDDGAAGSWKDAKVFGSPSPIGSQCDSNDAGDFLLGNERMSPAELDEKYTEYYEYLCQGIDKVLRSGISMDVSCETRILNSPFPHQNATICSALKPKYYEHHNEGPEIYSRKVFVGGLPIDITEVELLSTFAQFGPVIVDWPNKNENKSYYPPKGYVFLIFSCELSVRALVDHCVHENDKLFLAIHVNNYSQKAGRKVQIRPWRLADADYLVGSSVPVNLRRVVFVGGVPRPIRAVELAHMMDQLYGSVCCAGIDTDVEFKYPKGAGRVAFTDHDSYMRAINDRYAQINHGEVDKRVEMKPYVLDDQLCEECPPGNRSHAPFFCPHMDCLQYYCESCWTELHGSAKREDHKPLIKEA